MVRTNRLHWSDGCGCCGIAHGTKNVGDSGDEVRLKTIILQQKSSGVDILVTYKVQFFALDAINGLFIA